MPPKFTAEQRAKLLKKGEDVLARAVQMNKGKLPTGMVDELQKKTGLGREACVELRRAFLAAHPEAAGDAKAAKPAKAKKDDDGGAGDLDFGDDGNPPPPPPPPEPEPEGPVVYQLGPFRLKGGARA